MCKGKTRVARLLKLRSRPDYIGALARGRRAGMSALPCPGCGAGPGEAAFDFREMVSIFMLTH